jgi:hypothetical protein
MSLLGLPNEIWIKILSNLDTKELLIVSLVSNKGKELALHPALWTELDLTLHWKCPAFRRLPTVTKDVYQGCDSPILHKLRI